MCDGYFLPPQVPAVGGGDGDGDGDGGIDMRSSEEEEEEEDSDEEFTIRVCLSAHLSV